MLTVSQGDAAGAEDLFAAYFSTMMQRLISTEQSWTRYSPELRLLKTMSVLSGPTIGSQLDVIIPLFSRMSSKDKEIEVRETYVPSTQSY